MSQRSVRRGDGITLLIPFTAGVADDRDRIWDWSRRHWKVRLPGVQIVVADDPDHFNTLPFHPFSKAAAVNSAAARATGDILVIVDADAYIDAELLRYCAAEIRAARQTGRRLWYVPYRHFYRLSVQATERVLTSDLSAPWHPADPPAETDLDPGTLAKAGYGNFFAAMVMVMPAEAFQEAGGMDPRFQAWGGEDISFKRQVDTLYNPHKTINASVLHLHHATLGGPGVNRRWAGQVGKSMPFALLGARYLAARGDPARMRRLVDEWRNPTEEPDPDA